MGPYDGCKVYGPYLRKDGRKHVILIKGRHRRTVSYPKFLVEQRMGRLLTEDETVDHQDRDFTNDDPDNLIIRTRSRHASVDAIRVTPLTLQCPTCGNSFETTKLAQVRGNRRRGKAGPFCSKKCAGRYGAEVQSGRAKLPVLTDAAFVSVYYKAEK